MISTDFYTFLACVLAMTRVSVRLSVRHFVLLFVNDPIILKLLCHVVYILYRHSSFYRAMLCVNAVFAVAGMRSSVPTSVRLSVRLSRW